MIVIYVCVNRCVSLYFYYSTLIYDGLLLLFIGKLFCVFLYFYFGQYSLVTVFPHFFFSFLTPNLTTQL